MIAHFFKYPVAALLVLSGIYVLLHPARPATAVPASDFPGQITQILYWEKWSGEEARAMQATVDEFNTTVGRDKHIFVQYVSMSAVDQKTLVATAAGAPPDVAGFWDMQLAQFAAMDALEPLEELAAEHGLTRDSYKPTFWDACFSRGHLWATPSTASVIMLHFNRQMMEEHGDALRACGLNPDVPPQTFDQLAQFAEALTTYEQVNGKRRIKTSGFIPLEPNWYTTMLPQWFGGRVFDPQTQQLTLLSQPVIDTFEWITSYSKKFGKSEVSEFRSGVGGFDSTQNPFLTGQLAMEQQGPWLVNTIENYNPAMNRWHVPPDQLAREKNFKSLQLGMTREQVIALLGQPQGKRDQTDLWDAGMKVIELNFAPDGALSAKNLALAPAATRQKYCAWGVTPFPSALPGVRDAAYCGFDALAIPRGSKHKREAFEFIAFVNRQDVMERLCARHGVSSPLRKVSQEFIDSHPNPYIQKFEDVSRSPHAFPVEPIPIYAEVYDELNVAAEKCYLLQETPQQALEQSQERLSLKWNYFKLAQPKNAGQNN